MCACGGDVPSGRQPEEKIGFPGDGETEKKAVHTHTHTQLCITGWMRILKTLLPQANLLATAGRYYQSPVTSPSDLSL